MRRIRGDVVGGVDGGEDQREGGGNSGDEVASGGREEGRHARVVGTASTVGKEYRPSRRARGAGGSRRKRVMHDESGG